MIYEGREITPAISFAIVRKVEAGKSAGGIDMSAARGTDGDKFFVVEAAPYWLTTAGVKVEHNLRPGDRVYPRNARKMGETQIGKPIIDAPQWQRFEGLPKDHGVIALADIVLSERGAPQ